jgi:hypothetical protein
MGRPQPPTTPSQAKRPRPFRRTGRSCAVPSHGRDVVSPWRAAVFYVVRRSLTALSGAFLVSACRPVGGHAEVKPSPNALPPTPDAAPIAAAPWRPRPVISTTAERVTDARANREPVHLTPILLGDRWGCARLVSQKDEDWQCWEVGDASRPRPRNSRRGCAPGRSWRRLAQRSSPSTGDAQRLDAPDTDDGHIPVGRSDALEKGSRRRGPARRS